MAQNSDNDSISSTFYDESFEEGSSTPSSEVEIEEEEEEDEETEIDDEKQKRENSTKTLLKNDEIPETNRTKESFRSNIRDIQNKFLDNGNTTLVSENFEEKDDDEDNEISNDFSSYLEISSERPSDFNSDDYAFHINFLHHPEDMPTRNGKRYKNGTRKSLTFSNERMREIERHNEILLRKIISKGPSYETLSSKSKTSLKQTPSTTRVASAAINRKKQQRQIDNDNQILKRKIEAIATRKSRNLC